MVTPSPIFTHIHAHLLEVSHLIILSYPAFYGCTLPLYMHSLSSLTLPSFSHTHKLNLSCSGSWSPANAAPSTDCEMFTPACKGSAGEPRIDKSTLSALRARKQELLNITNVPLGECPPSPPRTAPPSIKG
ncbi:hypothetical protein NQZ68_027208 [Dissostichus eleginoides]|nr:hypothetical protein NQZ68_027208 [Dissostichus eleginoides]